MVKKFKDFIDYSKRIGKIIVIGKEGSGKSMLLARIAVGKMLHGLEDCWKSWDMVDEYNSLGMNLSKSYEHLSFTNFDVNCSGTEMPFRSSYRCNPYRLGLYDSLFKTDFFPPYALFCLAEGYNFLNAYLYNKFRDSFKGFIKTCRQAKYDLVVDCHSVFDICTLFRRLTNRFIFLYKDVEDIKNKDGVIVDHKLFVREFNDRRNAEAYETSDKMHNCREYELLLSQCMHENYDTDYCRYLALVGRKMQDFFIEHFTKIESVDDIEGLLEEFGTIAPEGFFVSGRGRKSDSEENDLSPPFDKEEIDDSDDWFG